MERDLKSCCYSWSIPCWSFFKFHLLFFGFHVAGVILLRAGAPANWPCPQYEIEGCLLETLKNCVLRTKVRFDIHSTCYWRKDLGNAGMCRCANWGWVVSSCWFPAPEWLWPGLFGEKEGFCGKMMGLPLVRHIWFQLAPLRAPWGHSWAQRASWWHL